VGGWTQTLLFAGALLVDWRGIWLTSRQGGWRIHSAGHWTERHGDFIILAVGESVVAIVETTRYARTRRDLRDA
jgi:low temperature requirement protein LtrA